MTSTTRKQIHTVYTYLGGDVHLHSENKQTNPNPTSQSRVHARVSTRHPTIHPSIHPSIRKRRRSRRDERPDPVDATRRAKKKAINPPRIPHRARSLEPPDVRARERETPRFYPRGSPAVTPRTRTRGRARVDRDAEPTPTRRDAENDDGWDERNRNRSMHPSLFARRPPPFVRRRPSGRRSTTADPVRARGSLRPKTTTRDSSHAVGQDGTGPSAKGKRVNEEKTKRTVRAMMKSVRESEAAIEPNRNRPEYGMGLDVTLQPVLDCLFCYFNMYDGPNVRIGFIYRLVLFV